MARGITPFIGLAVVMALALAAVFGSMSLANPAHAQATGPEITGLEVTNVTNAAVTLAWDFIDDEDYTATEFRATWSKLNPDGSSRFGEEIQATSGGAFEVTSVGSATAKAVATLTPAGGTALPFVAGDTFTIYVQSRKTDGSVFGEYASTTAVPNVTPGAAAVTAVSAVSGSPGSVELTWTYTAANDVDAEDVTGWQYRTAEYEEAGTADDVTDDNLMANSESDWMPLTPSEGDGSGADPFKGTVSGLEANIYGFQVRAMNGQAVVEDAAFAGTGAAANTIITTAAPPPAMSPTFEADSLEPGKNSWYTLRFSIDRPFNGGIDTLTMKLEGFGVPSSISTNNIALEVDAADGETYTFNPASVAVDGKEITLTIPDVAPEAETTKKDFGMGSNFRIVIYQGAGVSNPTKANTYGGADGVADGDREIFVIFSGDGPSKIWLARVYDGDEADMDHDDYVAPADREGVYVPRLVQLDENDGGLGSMNTATALGFEKGVTVHFFVDKPVRVMDDDGEYVMNTEAAIMAYNEMMSGDNGIPTMENDDGTETARHYEMVGTNSYALAPNGMLDAGEDIVCSDLNSGTVASCEFEITSPTFGKGFSYVNARDGDGNVADDSINGDQEFELKPSISVTPEGGSPGEVLQVQLYSFPEGAVTQVNLHGTPVCGGLSGRSCGEFGSTGIRADGTATLSIPIPNWAIAGLQELKVWGGGENETTNVTIAAPRIVSTPTSVVANQRVSLVGTGFSPNSSLGDDSDASDGSRISIGGYDIPWAKVNDGRDVNVDDGGNWSTSVDLPMVDATTGSGVRRLRVTDSGNRTGIVELTLQERDFNIVPASGRVGTLAVVRGVGYPSKNDEGHSFTVDVTYKVGERSSTRVSVVPDASGRFEVQLRIPTTASIPSTNQVEVSFNHEIGGTRITEVKQHMVPEGIIKLSATSGGPGSMVTVNGEGFKNFVPIESVRIGSIDVTPAPQAQHGRQRYGGV